MIMRIWRTGIDESLSDEYRRFAEENSIPMFRAQKGFVGVFFAATPGVRTVVTFWEGAAAAKALEQSASYQQTVAAIAATGFLVGPTTTEIFEVEGTQLTRPFVTLLPRMGTAAGEKR